VNVPDVPFADPKVELELEAADNVCKLYEQRLADFLELFKKVVNSLSWRDHQTPLEIKTIHHLCDRIIHVPAHVLIYIRKTRFIRILIVLLKPELV